MLAVIFGSKYQHSTQLKSKPFMAVEPQHFVAAEGFLVVEPQQVVAAELFEGAVAQAAVNAEHVVVCDDEWEARAKSAFVRLHNLRRQITRKNKRINELQHQLMIANSGSAAAAGDASKRSQRVCTGLMLSLLRGSGHASSYQVVTMGRALLPQSKAMKTRQTLNVWEIATAASILAESCKYHCDMETCMRTSGGSCWMAAGHVVMGDATRGKAWREEKLQPMKLISWYTSDDTLPEIASHTCWPDVQIVRGEDARSNFQRMHKQVRIVQCCCFDPHAASDLKPKRVRFVWLCGDNGGDQKAYRPIVARLFRDHGNVIVFGMPCLSHQYSLICCRQLAGWDIAAAEIYGLRFKYYAALVKISNLLRSRPVDVYKACVSFCNGDASHPFSKWGKTKCPKCIAGRWGSVLAVERYVLGLDHDISSVMSLSDFFAAMVHVLQAVWVDDLKSTRNVASMPQDEDAIDECAAAIEKRGRWFRQTHQALKDVTFRQLLQMSQTCKEPLAHFLFVLQSQPKDSRSLLEHLVDGKADQILAEVEQKHFATAEWFIAKCDDESCDNYCAMIAFSMLCQACEYDARILSLIHTFPAQMCWFVKMPPHVDCPRRRESSRKLLQAHPQRLDTSSLKIRSIMREELVVMRDTGKMDVNLHACFKGLFASSSVSIQCIESANKTVCHIGKIATGIKQPLLAARFVINKKLNPLTDQPGDMTSKTLALHHQCLQQYKSTSYDAITWYTGRWLDADEANGVQHAFPALAYCQHASLPIADCPRTPRPADVDGSADVHEEWRDAGDWFVGSRLPDDVTPAMLIATARYGLDWSKSFPACIRACFFFSHAGESHKKKRRTSKSHVSVAETVWVVPCKLSNIGFCVKMDVDTQMDTPRATICRPYHIRPSTQVVAAAWQGMQSSTSTFDCVHVMRASLTWLEPTVAEVGSPTSIYTIPKEKCKLPKPKPSKPRQPRQVSQSSTDTPVEQPDGHDSDEEVRELAEDLRAFLDHPSNEDMSWIDALVAGLDCQADEVPDAADDDDEPVDGGGAGIEPPPSESSIVAVVAADTRWQEEFLKSVDALKHRASKFAEALTWPCTAAARKYAASIGCNHALVSSCREHMTMALVVDNSSIPRVVHYPRTQ